MALPRSLKTERQPDPRANNPNRLHPSTTGAFAAANGPPIDGAVAVALSGSRSDGRVSRLSPTWLVPSEPDALVVFAA